MGECRAVADVLHAASNSLRIGCKRDIPFFLLIYDYAVLIDPALTDAQQQRLQLFQEPHSALIIKYVHRGEDAYI
jgi:hypothetical protein